MDTPIVALVAIVVHWFTESVKDVKNKNVNGIATRLIAIGLAWSTVVVAAHQVWAGTVHVLGSTSLSNLNGVGQLILAVGLAAGGGTLQDVLRTLNTSDPSVSSKLLGDKPSAPGGDV